MTDPLKLGTLPEVKPANPKEHPFTPVRPGSSACRWCSFAMQAHLEVAPGVQLHRKDQKKVQPAEGA